MPLGPSLVMKQTLGRGIVKLSLNNPAKLNVLSGHMIQTLTEELSTISKCTDTNVVILASSGKSFCTGHDIKEMMNIGPEIDSYSDLFTSCSALMMLIRALPQPVIAQVDGVATAAGCQLVSMCDLAIASENSRFATSGINFGLFCSTPAVGISRVMQPKKAFDMLVTGDFISAEEAARRGLINQSVPKDNLDGEVLEKALRIAAQPARAVQDGKRLFYRQLEMGIEEAYDLAGQEMASKMCEQEARDGFTAFLNKQEPPWRQSMK